MAARLRVGVDDLRTELHVEHHGRPLTKAWSAFPSSSWGRWKCSVNYSESGELFGMFH